MDIDDWRIEIDRVDEELVALLNRRAQCAIEIGRIKRRHGLPIYTPEREQEVLRHVAGTSEGPLEAAAVCRLFERIIDESRSLERVTVEHEFAEREGSDNDKQTGHPAEHKVRNRA